jgi:hypothetical protein
MARSPGELGPNDPLTLREAAETLLRGIVKASTLRAAAARGELTVERLGRTLVTTPTYVEQWRERRRSVVKESQESAMKTSALATAHEVLERLSAVHGGQGKAPKRQSAQIVVASINRGADDGLGTCCVSISLAGCTVDARVYALDPTSMAAGTPKIEFLRQGVGHGPVTVTMPDGEILKGEYQVEENAAIGLGFAGSQTFSTVALGSGRPVVLSATGEHTVINCSGSADIGGHGFGECQTSQGNKYRVMF